MLTTGEGSKNPKNFVIIYGFCLIIISSSAISSSVIISASPFIFRCLLEHGADPNGDFKNLCTPLAVVAQRGYYEGVKVSLDRSNLRPLPVFIQSRLSFCVGTGPTPRTSCGYQAACPPCPSPSPRRTTTSSASPPSSSTAPGRAYRSSSSTRCHRQSSRSARCHTPLLNTGKSARG